MLKKRILKIIPTNLLVLELEAFQKHTAIKWQNQDTNLTFKTPIIMHFPLYHDAPKFGS